MPREVMRGPYGEAWRVPFAPTRPAEHATIALWVLTAPNAHPHWSQYVAYIIHLRDIPGVPPVTWVKDATHQFNLWALHPRRVFSPEEDACPTGADWLAPCNIQEQWRAESDEQAVLFVEKLLKAVLAGSASPDTDFRVWWTFAFKAMHERRWQVEESNA